MKNMSGFPRQDEIDIYYEDKKKEVGKWLIEYAGDQKRLTQEQRKQILAYADRMSFSTAREANAYVQGLKTVGKKNKQKIFDYMQRIEWFPEGVNVGVLDGKIVSRVLPNELDLLYGLQNLKGENDGKA
jgi:hypothetical protein